jgi:hypothetical protein
MIEVIHESSSFLGEYNDVGITLLSPSNLDSDGTLSRSHVRFYII